MSEEKKIKLGKFLSKLNTVLLILFFLDTCVIVTIDFKWYMISVLTIAALFIISTVISHFCMKNYKPE